VRTTLTHGSLFTGIGGFDLAFALHGIATLWQVEIDPFCQAVLRKNFPGVSPVFRFTGTYTESADKILSESTSSAAASPVSPSVQRGRRKARETFASSGRRCLESYLKSVPDGSWRKTFVDSCLTTEDEPSRKYAPFWRLRVTKSSRSYFQLAVSVPRIGETGCGFWPTPQAHDAKSSGTAPTELAGKRHTPSLPTAVGGKLNPQFSEWLMGFPTDHTALNVSETQSCRKSPRGSGRKS
jgi:C-5 cytosine-specific DNA methylase